jgi:hypothetical protein
MAEMQLKSYDDVPRLFKDQQFLDKVQSNPRKAIKDLNKQVKKFSESKRALEQDKIVYRIVVTFLGSAIIVGIIGAIILSISSKTIPEILIAIASASVGALAGLLAPIPAAIGKTNDQQDED